MQPSDLSTKQLAKHLAVSEWLLKKWRREGTGPNWYRVPDTNLIRYKASDLASWKAAGAPIKDKNKSVKTPNNSTKESGL